MQLNQIFVLSGIFVPFLIYYLTSRKVGKGLSSSMEFLPTEKVLGENIYARSTATAGISLATVILAFLNLSVFMGLGLLWAVVTYVLGFVFLYFVSEKIRNKNPETDIIEVYLGKKYKSETVRNIALFFTIVGYLSIFAMEMLVGSKILNPIFGEHSLLYAFIFTIFVLVYTSYSGFKGTLAVEKWQSKFVLLFVASFIFVTFSSLVSVLPQINTVWTNSINSFSSLTLSFFIGLAFLNIPSTISDAGTWQRLSVVKTNTDAKKGLKKAILYFTLIWSTLVICSTLFFNSEILLKHFDPNQLTLSDYLITYLYHGGVLQNFILAIVFAGLLAAMITTSDSILIIISQMILFRLVGNSDEKKNITVKQIRLSMFAIGLFSFLIFSVFSYFNYDVVDLIFSIYGAQLALFFPVLISLYLKKEDILPKISKYVQCAILLGFLSGWASAIYGAKLGGDSVWLYNAGVVSFFVSGIIILFGYLKNKKFV